MDTLTQLQSKYRHYGLEVTIDSIITSAPRSPKAIVIGLYRPPNSTQEWFYYFSDLITELAPLGNLILLGDLNCNLLSPNSANTKKLMTIFELGQLKITQVFPTRIAQNSATCIDLIAISRNYFCNAYRAGDLAVSDHFPIEAVVEVPWRYTDLVPTYKRNFNRVDYSKLNTELSSLILPLSYEGNVELQLKYWMNETVNLIDKYAPLKACPMRKTKALLLPPDIIQMIHLRNNIARKVKADPCNIPLLTEFTLTQRKVKSHTAKFKKIQAEKALDKHDTKSAWKFIKQATNLTTIITKPPVDLVELNNFFANSITPPIPPHSPTKLHSCNIQDAFSLSHIPSHVVAQHLLTIKHNTSTGPDNLPALFLKKTATAIAPNIAKIFNTSITSSHFPVSWKQANITPVYKGKGGKKDPQNYRPISVLPCLARIFEKEIAKQLSTYVLQRGLIPKQQFGFRQNASTETALLAAMENWVGELDKQGMMVGLLLIDLTKAFDNVNHALLVNDLSQIGCDTSSLSFLSSYLTGREQRVVFGGDTTDWMQITKGVPQGSGISPLLFNIYVRGLPDSVNDPIFQFADDITNSTSSTNADQIKIQLEQNFQSIQTFCSNKDLPINIGKTQFVVLKLPSKKIDKDIELSLDSHIIKPTSSVELLGLTIDQHLSFKEHIAKTSKKCHGILGVINKARHILPTNLLKLSYTALVRPHLEYCSLVLASASKSNLNKLEVVQKIASRIILDQSRDTHAAPLLLSLGLQPLEKRRQTKILKSVDKILTKNCHPHLYNLFQVDNDGLLSNKSTRTTFGKKRFGVYARESYNKFLALND